MPSFFPFFRMLYVTVSIQTVLLSVVWGTFLTLVLWVVILNVWNLVVTWLYTVNNEAVTVINVS